MKNILILLIEDNRLLRESIASILLTQPDIETITQPANGKNINQLKSLKKIPQIVLLDFCLPIRKSLSLLTTIKKEYPETKVIAFNVVADEVDIIGIVKAGASGFILRDASSDDFINTIRKVMQGENVLPMALTNSLFYQIANYVVTSNNNYDREPIKLTNREEEIIALIGNGLCNKEIAQILHISTETVKSHVHNILKKLAVRSRLQVANFSHIQKNRKNHPGYTVNQRLNSCENHLQNGNLFPHLASLLIFSQSLELFISISRELAPFSSL